MCGRFSFVVSKEKIKVQLGDIETGNNLHASYNIAPTQHAYVITNDNPNRLQHLTWGLIPYWSRDGKNSGKLINARMEGLGGKPSFRVPIRRRRCLVLADSFYEWRKEGNAKIPYRIFLKNGDLMLMAGIWDIWSGGEYPVKSFSIITAPSNKEVTPLHNRMPLIFPHREQQIHWLEDISLEEVLDMLQPPEDNFLDMYKVSDKVNSYRNDSPELHLKTD